MFRRNNNKPEDPLELATTLVARSSKMSEDQVEAIASRVSYRAVQARIEAGDDGSLAHLLAAIFAMAPRAIPAMAIATLLALAWSFLFAGGTGNKASLENAIAGSAGSGVQRVRTGGTCAISTSDQCSVSTEDVLATLVKEEVK